MRRLAQGWLALLLFVALLGPWLAPFDPRALDLLHAWAPPGGGHLLGTGGNGIDLLTHLLLGARISLGIALATVATSLTLGTLLGSLAGWRGGLIDGAVMRSADVLLAFPGLLLALFLTAVIGPSLGGLLLALTATGWTGTARLVRAEVRAYRAGPQLEGSLALGGAPQTIWWRHVLPQLRDLLRVQATLGLSGAVLAEASLSFLGLGVPPGTPSWGALAEEGAAVLLLAPHVVLLPGACILATVLSLDLLAGRSAEAARASERP